MYRFRKYDIEGKISSQKDRAKLLTRELGERILLSSTPITGIKYIETDYIDKMVAPEVTNEWKDFDSAKDTWGGKQDQHLWFAFSIEVPKFETGVADLTIATDKSGWDARNPQFVLFMDGKIVQGLDINHTSVRLTPGEKHEVMLYAYTGTEINEATKLFATIDNVDDLCEKLYYDFIVPCDILDYTREDQKEYADITTALLKGILMIDLRKDSPDYRASLERASEYMDKEFYGKFCGKNDTSVVAVGHTHIDIAWLWSTRQTKEKAVRSFATVVNLMKRYPEYKFSSSQVYLYEAVKEKAPELYEEIKKLIAEGRFEVEGSMWVEADCNLISGESLARQVFYGKRFFNQEFGVNTRTLWLPDVFGYAASLPQILLKSGVDRFVTSKISWNDTNRMPFDVFWWKGIDGSKIFSHFITTQDKRYDTPHYSGTTYVGMGTAPYVAGSYDRFQQKYLSNEAMLVYGYGDGGGGPTVKHIENLKRTSKGIPNCPKTTFGVSEDFISKLQQKALKAPYVPTWSGELYLEYHRGTYTSQARNKWNNRKSEFALQNAEKLSITTKLLDGKIYPKKEIFENWKTVMVNQFHDIIPGSSVHEVYETSDREYAEVFASLGKITGDALSLIASKVSSADGTHLVYNPNSFEYTGAVEIDGKYYTVKKIPALGYKVVTPVVNSAITVEKGKIENARIRVKFDKACNIVSIYDKKAKREVLPKGAKANELRLFDDYNLEYNAWEMEHSYAEKYYEVDAPVSVEEIREGSKAGLKVVRKIGQSEMTQKILVDETTAKIDFITDVDWHERRTLIRTYFPTGVNSDTVTCNIQYGNAQRTLNKNTTWERAKFEVCAQKFVDASDGDYGVTLINDSKYGHSYEEGVIGLSLLKAPTYPDPTADQGKHKFNYSLYLHTGTFSVSDAVEQSYVVNNPPVAVEVSGNGTLPSEFSIVKSSMESFVIETVKEEEDGDGIIVRGYEAKNKKGKTKLTFGFDVKEAFIVNICEKELSSLTVKNNAVEIPVAPYEIITLKLKV